MKKRILVIDDDEAILDAIKTILVSIGYEVTLSTNGSVLHTQSIIPDLVLLDLRLSESSGTQVLEGMKHRHLQKRIPVIVMSANRDLSHVATTLGANGFLTKPFEMNELVSTVRSILQP